MRSIVISTALKLAVYSISFAGLILFSRATGDAYSVSFYINTIAMLSIIVTIMDAGQNSVNSNIYIDKYKFLSTWLFDSKIVSVVLIIFLCCIPAAIYAHTNGIILALILLISAYFRMQIMRWITVYRKDSTDNKSIIYGELPLSIINATSLLFLYVSKYAFLNFMALMLMILYILIGKKYPVDGLDSFLNNLRNKNCIKHGSTRKNVLHIMQSYMSGFKNNLLGALVGDVSGGHMSQTILVANRITQMYSIGYSGVVNDIPKNMRIEAHWTKKNVFTLYFLPPLFLICIALLYPKLLVDIVSAVYGIEIASMLPQLLASALFIVVCQPLSVFLVHKGRVAFSLTLESFLILQCIIVYYLSL